MSGHYETFDTEDVAQPVDAAKGTFFTTTTTTLINIVGGGVLTLPMAMHNSSIAVACVLLTVITLLSIFTSYVMAAGSEVTRYYSYHEVFARVLVGPMQKQAARLIDPSESEDAKRAIARRISARKWLGAFCDVIVCLTCFALLVMYARVIGDSMPPVAQALGGTGFWLQKETYYVWAGVMFFLLTCIRTLTELLAASIIGVATILNVAVAIVIRYSEDKQLASNEALADVRYFDVDMSLFNAIPAFTMACALYQTNVPIYYHELAGRTPQRMLGICATANGIALVVYVVVGVCGYLTFGSDVARADIGGNIANNYSKGDLLLNVARFGLFVHFLCVFPVVAINCRHGIHRIALHIVGRHDDAHDPETVFNAPSSAIAVEAGIVTVSAVVCGAYIPGIFFVVNLTGATAGMFAAFIAPGFMGVVLWSGDWDVIEERDDGLLTEPPEPVGRRPLLRALSAATAIFGIVAGVTALVLMDGPADAKKSV
jgi:amino acid permease